MKPKSISARFSCALLFLFLSVFSLQVLGDPPPPPSPDGPPPVKLSDEIFDRGPASPDGPPPSPPTGGD